MVVFGQKCLDFSQNGQIPVASAGLIAPQEMEHTRQYYYMCGAITDCKARSFGPRMAEVQQNTRSDAEFTETAHNVTK